MVATAFLGMSAIPLIGEEVLNGRQQKTPEAAFFGYDAGQNVFFKKKTGVLQS